MSVANERPRRPIAIAFAGSTCLAAGDLPTVAAAVKAHAMAGGAGDFPSVLVFDGETSQPLELDLRGTLEEVLARLELTAARGEVGGEGGAVGEGEAEGGAPLAPRPGRPKLGVVAREVTLLPRHWEWLAGQPGGASVALRKLVEEARKTHAEADRLRLRREAVYRFAVAIAGNEPGFEEAARALFAGDRERFEAAIAPWPVDVRTHAADLAADAFV